MSAVEVVASGFVNHEIVRQELEQIAKAGGGHLSPQSVVEAARLQISPLHDYFIWDDTDAANRFRLVQAGLLIRRIRITVLRPELPPKRQFLTIRHFQSEVELRGKAQGSYATVGEIMADPDRRASLLESVKSELASIRQRYEGLTELATIWKAIDRLR